MSVPAPRYIILSLLLLATAIVQAKEKDHTLNGKLKVKGGDTYPYQLVFGVTHSSVIKGYSITKLSDGTDNKTEIRGVINKEKHIIIFAETKLLSAPLPDATACMVNAVLTYKLKGGNYALSGFFKGKDSDHKDCGEGSLEFTIPATADDLFADDTATVAKPEKMESAAVLNEAMTGDDKITAGVGKEFQWHSDTCVVAIWDGGVIDGDVVSLSINDRKVLDNYTLVKERKLVKLPLTGKVNTITILAEDEGLNPPNTAEMILYDGETSYKVTAFNKKGEKAIIVLRR